MKKTSTKSKPKTRTAGSLAAIWNESKTEEGEHNAKGVGSTDWMDALAQRWQWHLDKMQKEYDEGDRGALKMVSMIRQKLCLDQFNAARKSASIGGAERPRADTKL